MVESKLTKPAEQPTGTNVLKRIIRLAPESLTIKINKFWAVLILTHIAGYTLLNTLNIGASRKTLYLIPYGEPSIKTSHSLFITYALRIRDKQFHNLS